MPYAKSLTNLYSPHICVSYGCERNHESRNLLVASSPFNSVSRLKSLVVKFQDPHAHLLGKKVAIFSTDGESVCNFTFAFHLQYGFDSVKMERSILEKYYPT